MPQFRVGCTGWAYDDWRTAGFYPPGTEPREYLQRYARVFDLTEVDGTYYAAPTPTQTTRWAESTPPGFTFTVKFPGAMTHKARLRDVDEPLTEFLRALEPLRRANKLGPLLLQLPSSFTRNRDEAALHAFLQQVPDTHALAVELRHPTWWHPDTYRALEARNTALVWSVNQYADTPPVATADFVYARFIGDRALTRFTGIQRDNTPLLEAWRARLLHEAQDARIAFILLNNHFMGFAPATAARMQALLGLPPSDLAAASRDRGQRALSDYS